MKGLSCELVDCLYVYVKVLPLIILVGCHNGIHGTRVLLKSFGTKNGTTKYLYEKNQKTNVMWHFFIV
jgi:hypothetical protein